MINRKLKVIHFTIAGIAIGQVIWWAYLLISQQYALAELLKGESALEKAHHFKFMIISEGTFFILVWCLAMWSAYRSFIEHAGLRRAHSDFLGAVTHELKTPIANIQLCFDTLERPHLSDEMKSKYIRRGQESLTRLLSEVDSVLQLSHADQRSMVANDIDIADLIQACLQNIDASALQHIELVNEVQPGTRIRVPVDETRVVIKNLIDNALKYSKPSADGTKVQGRVRIFTEQKDSKTLLLKIQDNGIGLSEDELEHVFDPFWRSQSAIQQAKSGTGVGLALARNLALRAGLKLEIKSEGRQRGVTALLIIPLTVEKASR